MLFSFVAIGAIAKPRESKSTMKPKWPFLGWWRTMKERPIEAAWMVDGVFRCARQEYANGIGPTPPGENRFVNAKQHYGIDLDLEAKGKGSYDVLREGAAPRVLPVAAIAWGHGEKWSIIGRQKTTLTTWWYRRLGHRVVGFYSGKARIVSVSTRAESRASTSARWRGREDAQPPPLALATSQPRNLHHET